MSYITVDYYQNEYQGITVADIPTLEKLITRASNQIDILIQYKLQGRDFNALPSFIVQNVMLATASQVEYLATNGETAASVLSGSDSFRIGNYSESGGGSSATSPQVKYSSDVRGYLLPTGLLYGGVCIHG